MTTSIGQATSKDGTRIGFERTGSGPPLVLVHGTTADHTRWAPVLPALEARFTVHSMDRRGRGLSGDNQPYALEREHEDIAAVIDSTGGRVDVVAHSHGALCALEAALLTDHVRRLVLYEPPLLLGASMYEDGFREGLDALLARGEREELLTTFFRVAVGASDADLQMLRDAPSWAPRVAAAHTIPRELIHAEYVLDPGRFANFNAPVLLLLGGASPPSLVASTDAFHAALPNSSVASMPGQGHIAMNTAPDMFTRLVLDFLSE